MTNTTPLLMLPRLGTMVNLLNVTKIDFEDDAKTATVHFVNGSRLFVAGESYQALVYAFGSGSITCLRVELPDYDADW